MTAFERIAIGDLADLGRHRFTAEEIKRFARAYDPQPFHVDEAAAKASHFGALCASGWHTAAVCMRMIVDSTKRLGAEMIERGEKPARSGPSPGFNDLKWLKPVYAGDTITYATEITAMRTSSSRPEWGLATLLTTGDNQNGERVISFDSISFVPRRV